MSITQFYLTVTGENAVCTAPEDLILTSGSTGVYEAVISADDTWNALTLEAVFVAAPASWPANQSAAVIRRAVPLENGRAAVPEALFSKAGFILYAGLSGMAEGVERNSTLALVRRIQTGADPDGPGTEDISPTRYQQLLAQIESLKESGAGSGTVTASDTTEPADEDIPKVFLTGTLPTTKTNCTMGFRYISKTDDFRGYVEIKCQGNSSMSYAKKNFTVKMYEDEALDTKMKQNFKDWGKQNKHVYKANWIDLTHARNIVSARLWGDLVKSRSSYDELPEELRTAPNQGAVDGFPVKLYSNGIYQGRYTLNIPKDKWMANMDDDLDEHCILCSENYVSGCFRAAANINGNDWTDEIHDAVPASIKTRWNEIIDFVMNSTDEAFVANLEDYFYVDSLIDYHLFGLISCGLDAYGKNQLYMTYDGQKWIATMYDMDSTWGLWWNGSYFVSTSYDRSEYQDFKDGSGNLLYIRLESLFLDRLQARWDEVKNTVLSVDHIINRFERFTDITPASLMEEDYASTTGGGAFTGIPSKSTNNIQQIRSYIIARHAWTEDYIAGLTPAAPVPCEGISLSAESLTFTGAETQTLTATVTPEGCTDALTWESNNESVVTVADGVVTAIGNGSATITVYCGEYSASCTIQVSGFVNTVSCTGITLNQTSLNFTGTGTQTLTATITPEDTTDSLVWNSDNEVVATVADGVVTAIDNGSATITATCGSHSAACTVAVSGIVGLYPLDNGETSFANSGATVTVTNGNHVKVEILSAANYLYCNLSDLTANTNASNSSSNLTCISKLFDLSAGDVVTRTLSNMSATGTFDASDRFTVNLKSSNSELQLSGSAIFMNNPTDATVIDISHGDNVSTYTADKDYEIGLVTLWFGTGLQAGMTLEFDLGLYVNGVKYV